MQGEKWLLNKTNEDFISYLCGAASVSPILAQVLINRGVKTPEQVREFMSPGPGSTLDPFALDGMAEAVSAIKAAKKDAKKIFVHGDYDADGLSATTIMVEALQALGIKTGYFIPSRFKGGYGFHPLAVEAAKAAGASLIVTVDCGISSFEAVELAKAEGIDVVITDHHEPEEGPGGASAPDALAVVNPKLMDPVGPPFSGAGIALKVAEGLGLDPSGFYELAALGTIADVVPLTGENRVIVREGLNIINNSPRPGVSALRAVSGLNGKQAKAVTLAFTLLPRINAAGRVGDASEVVELLLTRDDAQAAAIAAQLNERNQERQKIEKKVFEAALRELEQKEVQPAIVLCGEDWHEGVLGIVASKIAERFSRPVFILSSCNGIARGSARSVPGFDVHSGLSGLSDILLSFGGHKQAAGLRLKLEDMEAFSERMSQAVQADLKDFTPTVTIDAEVGLDAMGFALVRELEALEPFGCGNPEPLLGARGLEVIDHKVVGRNHLKMKLKHRGRSVEAIGFDMGEEYERMDTPVFVDAVFRATINEWERGKTLQMNLKALRGSDTL